MNKKINNNNKSETSLKDCDLSYKYEYSISGMHCPACEIIVQKKIEKLSYVKASKAILIKNMVYIEADTAISKLNLAQDINSIINSDGYEVSIKKIKHKINLRDLSTGFIIALAIASIFFLIQKLGFSSIIGGKSMSLALVFLIGLVASFSSCMAVVGGLVLFISSNYAKSESRIFPLVLFHISRITGFFFLGGILGLIGTTFRITPLFYFIMSIVLFIVMMILGINLLELFPFLRKINFTLPTNMSVRLINLKKKGNKFNPVLLGMITFFLPCGFTQSMQINAVASGNLLNGAFIMLVFALGTLPVLALISFTSVKLVHSLKSGIFFKTSGFIIIFLAVYNLYSSLIAAGILQPVF